MKKNNSLENFSTGSVTTAVFRNIIPSIAAMIMVLEYNLADTFFVGLTGNDYMVAAVSLATPVFLIFMALGTLFGMGGTLIGNLLNVILDPIMIFTFNWGIAGAAIATVIGNVVACLFYLVYFWSGKSALSISPKKFSMKEKICTGVLAIGIPASLGSILMSVSQMVANSRIASYGDMAVAAYGVAAKILMIAALVGIGIGQRVQPLLGFCYGSKNRKRFGGVLKCSLIISFILCTAVTALCALFIRPLVTVFLTDHEALGYGVTFSLIMLSTSWFFGVYYVLMNTVQAIGAATPAFILSLCRQGLVYIPAVFILDALIGMNGIAWAQPVADTLSLVLTVILCLHTLKKIRWEKA